MSAAFGLARTYLAQGDRSGALEVLESVPDRSSHFIAAQMAVIATRTAWTPPQRLTERDLVDAGGRVERLNLDAERRATLTADVLRAGVNWVRAGRPGGRRPTGAPGCSAATWTSAGCASAWRAATGRWPGSRRPSPSASNWSTWPTPCGPRRSPDRPYRTRGTAWITGSRRGNRITQRYGLTSKSRFPMPLGGSPNTARAFSGSPWMKKCSMPTVMNSALARTATGPSGRAEPALRALVDLPPGDAQHARRDVQRRADRHRPAEVGLQPAGDSRHAQQTGQRPERLVERGGQQAAVRQARCALVLLGHGEAGLHGQTFADRGPDSQAAGHVRTAAEALGVVRPQHGAGGGCRGVPHGRFGGLRRPRCRYWTHGCTVTGAGSSPGVLPSGMPRGGTPAAPGMASGPPVRSGSGNRRGGGRRRWPRWRN